MDASLVEGCMSCSRDASKTSGEVWRERKTIPEQSQTFLGRLKMTICWAMFDIVDCSGTTKTDYVLGDFSYF